MTAEHFQLDIHRRHRDAHHRSPREEERDHLPDALRLRWARARGGRERRRARAHPDGQGRRPSVRVLIWPTSRRSRARSAACGVRPMRVTSGGRLVSCPKPVIAAIDGPAVGMGAEFSSQCDVRLATPRARFAWNFAHRGLVPDTGAGSWLLPRLLGPQKALQLLYSGDFLECRRGARGRLRPRRRGARPACRPRARARPVLPPRDRPSRRSA